MKVLLIALSIFTTGPVDDRDSFNNIESTVVLHGNVRI